MAEEKEKETNKKEDEEKKDSKPDTDEDVSLKDEEPAESEEEKKKKEEANKKKYANWPLRGIKEPHENDVLYGRGGGTNHHPGNKIYRKMVEERKLDYVNSKRLDKPLVALEIIRNWRGQSPPGRFLKMDDKSGTWEDVGDKKAREKTSQALREKAPEIRRKQEEDAMIKAGKDPKVIAKEKEKKTKETRFEAGTKDHKRDQVAHGVLARDHSLGREYLGTNEKLGLDGFTWNPAALDRVSSYGSTQGGGYPPGRFNSYGSQGVMPPQFPPSRAGSHSSIPPPPMPPPGPDYYRNMSQEDRQRSLGSAGYDSWSRLPSGGSVPPPMPPYGGGSPYQQHRSGSFGMHRDHSLSHNPLRDASISQPAAEINFDRRNGSGYWGDPNMPPPPPPPPHGMPSPSFGGPRYMSGDSAQYAPYDPKYAPPPGGMPPASMPPASMPPASMSPASMSPGPTSPKPPYQVDPAIAKSWTTTQPEDYAAAADMFGGPDLRKSYSGDSNGDDRRQQVKTGTFPESSHIDPPMMRPDMVKRMTSNQNEDFDTKRDYTAEGPSIKRAALNRDSSETANRLKAKYAPGALKKPTAIDKEMRGLSISMEQSTLDAKPRPLALDERTSTIDTITMELMTKPNSVEPGTRSTTIEALALDLDVDVDLDALDNGLPRPQALRTEGRLSTAEYIDIVNEPLGDDEVQQQRALDLNREASVSEWLSQG